MPWPASPSGYRAPGKQCVTLPLEPAPASNRSPAAGAIGVDSSNPHQERDHASDSLIGTCALRLFLTAGALRQAPPAHQCACGETARHPGPEPALMPASDAQAYFEAAESWDADRVAQFRRNTRIAWRVAGAGWLCAVASGAALLLL